MAQAFNHNNVKLGFADNGIGNVGDDASDRESV